MANKVFSVSGVAVTGQPAGEQLYFRSTNAADSANLSLTGLVSAVSTTETNALLGRREVQTADLFTSLSAALLSATQAGLVSVFGQGVQASGPIIVSSQPADGDTILIGLVGFTHDYTFKTALTELFATDTVSDTGAPADADTVTVNGRVYTFKTTLTGAADEIFINGQDGSLTNLAAAINNTGVAGTDYGTGTTINADVTSGAVVSHGITLTAKVVGIGGNALTLAKSGANLAVGGANFTGGVDPVLNEILIGSDVAGTATHLSEAIQAGSGAGIDYSTGTTANEYVSPTVSGAIVTITDLIACHRQLAWAVSQGVGATLSISQPAGGVNGTLLAKLSPGLTQIWNTLSFASEDLVALTLPAKVVPTTASITIDGKQCCLRFKCSNVVTSIPVKYQTSTDGVNWSDGVTSISNLDDNSVATPLFVAPGEENIDKIRLVFTGNTNTTDTALDARVIFPRM
jgi:hypothetical protein